MLDNNLNNLRKYEFEYLITILKQELFENILEIGPGNTPVTKFRGIHSYIGIEKVAEDEKNNIYKMEVVNDKLKFNVDLVIAMNSIYFIDDIAKFYSNFNNFDPKYFIYILPTPTWRIWTSLSAYIAFFLKENNSQKSNEATKSFFDKIFLKRHGIRGNRFNEFIYYRKNYWSDTFSNVHKNYSLYTEKIGLFYTGFNLLGSKLPINFRKILARILGASSRVYVLSRVN